jgi:hypothetical protein
VPQSDYDKNENKFKNFFDDDTKKHEDEMLRDDKSIEKTEEIKTISGNNKIFILKIKFK